MGNPNLLPYETIVRATSGEPEAVDEVLRHYSKRIRIAAIENGHINRDTEDNIKSRLVAALFKFLLMNRKYKKSLSFLGKRIYNKAQIKWE
ncbi:hypothetical protein IMSAG185_01357 [Lachnospiraceae bacterium]|nr:hypothetical protein IMSAG185_01357 [Lachnospiraceae bacterium]